MIVNTDAGMRPLQSDPIVFKNMIRGGRDVALPIGMSGFPERFQAMAYEGFGADEPTGDTGPTADVETPGIIDQILSAGTKLGDAYTQYLKYQQAQKAKAAAAALPAPVPVVSAGIPTWVWIAGGVVLVGGGALLLMKRRR